MEEQTNITLSRVLESGIFDEFDVTEDLMHLGIRKLGGEWFKDRKTGKAYGVVEEDGDLKVTEVVESKKNNNSDKPKTAVITCVDCGAERNVATQDAFQVKRCEDCQRTYRNAKRRESSRRRRAEKRRVKDLNALNGKEEEVEAVVEE